jgi:hypothetical protein
MTSVNYACSLNNQGVDLLVSGEFSKARKVFQSVLSLLKNEAEPTSCTAMNISHDGASKPFCESTSTVAGLQGVHCCYVYDHGFMIFDNGDVSTSQLFFSIWHWRLTPKEPHSGERNH